MHFTNLLSVYPDHRVRARKQKKKKRSSSPAPSPNPAPSPTPTPTPTKYGCVNGECILTAGGTWPNADMCKAEEQCGYKYFCSFMVNPDDGAITPRCSKWEPVEGVKDYNTADECYASCIYTPPPSYSCVNGKCVDTPNGPYPTLEYCQKYALCGANKFACVYNKCQRVQEGPYNSLAECLDDKTAQCDWRYSCKWVYPNPNQDGIRQCVWGPMTNESIQTPSLSECQAKCV